MKNLYYFILMFTSVMVLVSCKKEEEVALVADTPCPSNTDCSYLYNDNLDIGDYTLNRGNNKVFQAMYKTEYSTASLNFKVPVNVNQFYISETDIKDDAVKYFFVCPVCDWIAVKPVAGYIKGNKVGNNQWLVDAEVIMAAIHDVNNQFSDTIRIKKYFYSGLKAGPVN